jgi:hypothetical protein
MKPVAVKACDMLDPWRNVYQLFAASAAGVTSYLQVTAARLPANNQTTFLG